MKSSINIKLKSMLLVCFSIVLLALCVSIFVDTNAQADTENYTDYVPGEVIVCVETDPYFGEPDRSNLLLNQINTQMDNFLSKYECETLLCIAGNDSVYNQLVTNSDMVTIKDLSGSYVMPAQTRYVKIKFDESQKSMNQMIAELKTQPGVKNAEPNYVMGITSNAAKDYTDAQYAYDTEGATGTTHNKAGMNVANWNTSTPNINPDDKAVVAVIDSGVDYNHPDILCAGDTSQYGDLSAITGIGGPQGYNAAADPASQESKDPMDNSLVSHGHGTHVAGIIAATWNNYGVSGGASVCSILPVKGTAKGSKQFLNSSVIRAFAYVIKAKQSGINIKAVNNSWGGPSNSSFVVDLINLAGQQCNIISVFGTGNDSKNIDNYTYTASSFQNNPYVITVDSTNCNGFMSVFSNYGIKTTDVCAPGDGIYSTVPSWEDGQNDNLMAADTRFMNQDEYEVKDDFESNTKNFNFKYYSDLDCKNELTATTGSSINPKGYDSDKALLLPKESVAGSDAIQYLVIAGDYDAIKDYKRISILVNADSEGRNADSFQVSTADYYTFKELSSTLFTPAANVCPYASVSVQTSQLTETDGKFKLAVGFMYRDENGQYIPSERYVDNVCLTNAEYPYNIKTGTSMASPACCGVAAAVAANFKDETAEQIVARIKGGTNHKECLADKCYSGGIVDFSRASSTNADIELDPVVLNAKLESTTDSSTTIKLEGYFLGDSNSIVTINGVTASSVVSGVLGNRQTLECVFPSKIVGYCSVTVNKLGKSLTKYFDIGGNDYQILDRLPLPDKSSEEFKDFYNSYSTKLVYASNKFLCAEHWAEESTSSCIYNIDSQSWSKLDYAQTILAAMKKSISDIDSSSLICAYDDIMVFDGEKSGQGLKGLAFYNLENGEIDVVSIVSENVSLVTGFVNDDILYFIGKTNNITSLYSLNENENKLDIVQDGIECGQYPQVSKLGDNSFLLIDKATPFYTVTYSMNDMYVLTLDKQSNGAKCEKMDQVAYPSLVMDTSQDKCVGQAVVDGMLMMSGPAIFDEVSNGVKADTFLRNIQTKEEVVVPGLLSNNKAWLAYSAKGGDYVYTYFLDANGPAIAKRYVGSPVPPTPDPTPQDNELSPITTAATGDNTLPFLFWRACL